MPAMGKGNRIRRNRGLAPARPQVTAAPEGWVVCSGTEIEHEDDTSECSLGKDCLGIDELHHLTMSCGMLAVCVRCTTTSAAVHPLLGTQAGVPRTARF